MALSNGTELIRAVRVALDKIESFRNESFQEEEIALYLNKSQYRLIDDLVNKNFQQGMLRYEWLRPFQDRTTPADISGLWSFIADDVNKPVVASYLTLGVNTTMLYPIALRVAVVKSGINDQVTFDDNCDQIITDPNNIANPLSKTHYIRIHETGEAIEKTNNSFYGSNPRRPRAEAGKDGFYIYRGDYFIISDVTLDYINIPADITPSSSSFEWSTSALEKIVDYTVEYMRLTISDPTYQGNVQDFNLRTQNA